MTKVVKLDVDEVVLADEEKNIFRVPYEELDFKPELHDEVEIFQDGNSLIVTKAKNKSNSPEDKISINIINDNVQQQANMNYVQAGRVVNKLVYVLLALFLGGIGGHKFYAGKTGTGILYLLFSWTFVPSLLSIIEAIVGALIPSDSNGNIVL